MHRGNIEIYDIQQTKGPSGKERARQRLQSSSSFEAGPNLGSVLVVIPSNLERHSRSTTR